jgi:periplasmic protein TonB
LNLRSFLVYSFIIHILVFALAAFFLQSVKETKPGDEFSARLVSPEEFLHGKTPSPSVPPTPSVPSTPKIKPFPQKPSAVAPPSLPEKGTGDIPEKTGKQMPLPFPQPQITPPVEPRAGRQGREGIQQPEPPSAPSLREKLFDKGVIQDFARRDQEKEETEKKEKTFSLDTSEYKFLIYNKRLKEKIESIWVYPPDAASQGIYGDLVIRFTIKKNGRLGAVELVRTSGHKSLDDAAIKALKEGQPYWPLPENWGMEAYTIQGHFVYTLYGYYVQ